MQASKAWRSTMALAACFDGPQAFTCRLETRTIFISHFDWFGVQLPKPASRPHVHHVHLHVKRIQDLPNFQDILGCSAYQFTKIWINQSDLGPDFSFRLISILAHNICICSNTKPPHAQLVFTCCLVFIGSSILLSCLFWGPGQLFNLSFCSEHLSLKSPSTCYPSGPRGFQHTSSVLVI